MFINVHISFTNTPWLAISVNYFNKLEFFSQTEPLSILIISIIFDEENNIMAALPLSDLTGVTLMVALCDVKEYSGEE